MTRIISRASDHATRTAIVAEEGTFSYADLLDASAGIAEALLNGKTDLDEARVAFLVPPGFTHVAVQWGIWRAGGIGVPLCAAHPSRELEYVIEDADAATVVTHPSSEETLRPLAEARGLQVLPTDTLPSTSGSALPSITADRRAMILYTSGTTGRPKGVVTTHRTLEAQIETLIEAWEWRSDDHILHVLPLHHVHGIVNVLCCALWSGSTCEMLPKFDAGLVWRRFVESDLTLFMAVPTIYSRLIACWNETDDQEQVKRSRACAKMRLMVSGSAALPVQVLDTWRSISGHTLLERYGMTEIGMALSNPLHGERVPGSVGTPLPGVEVRLIDERGSEASPATPGEIEVRGPSVFSEYWRRPDATRETFREGWFRTGDIAVIEDRRYRILGRNSVDIIKTGGYKVSALEIEEILRTHPDIAECAVIGVADEEWGERVAVAVVLTSGSDLTLERLRVWAKTQLATYKVPTRFLPVDGLPRNALGKVVKPRIRELFETSA